jgi:hypothetical protein
MTVPCHGSFEVLGANGWHSTGQEGSGTTAGKESAAAGGPVINETKLYE